MGKKWYIRNDSAQGNFLKAGHQMFMHIEGSFFCNLSMVYLVTKASRGQLLDSYSMDFSRFFIFNVNNYFIFKQFKERIFDLKLVMVLTGCQFKNVDIKLSERFQTLLFKIRTAKVRNSA